jgi:putative endonuclease
MAISGSPLADQLSMTILSTKVNFGGTLTEVIRQRLDLDRFGKLLRRYYIVLGDRLDCWYEELPWRRQAPLHQRSEAVARRHLQRCGYFILARNYRAMGGEIDLVALDGLELVFVEVRTRGLPAAALPQEAADEEKREQIRHAAAAYVAARRAHRVATRFEVIALTRAGRGRHLEHLKDAL